ncbi:MAG: hypothetical protein AAB295_05850, partial [Chloroflexota bacterium]
MFFYEIHEGDEDVGTAVLLGHEEEFEPVDFFALVKKVRLLVMGSYEEASLAEAIANELQRSHGFVHVTDDKLLASVNVDESDENTFLVTDGDDARTVVTRLPHVVDVRNARVDGVAEPDQDRFGVEPVVRRAVGVEQPPGLDRAHRQ